MDSEGCVGQMLVPIPSAARDGSTAAKHARERSRLSRWTRQSPSFAASAHACRGRPVTPRAAALADVSWDRCGTDLGPNYESRLDERAFRYPEQGLYRERTTGFEPATLTLAR